MKLVSDIFADPKIERFHREFEEVLEVFCTQPRMEGNCSAEQLSRFARDTIQPGLKLTTRQAAELILLLQEAAEVIEEKFPAAARESAEMCAQYVTHIRRRIASLEELLKTEIPLT